MSQQWHAPAHACTPVLAERNNIARSASP
jgi:hypothetical protein